MGSELEDLLKEVRIMKKLGLIINPIAGMGGSVGLKGTDNTAAEAFRRGAVPRAGDRAKAALSELLPVKEEILVYTCPGAMGGDTAEEMGFQTVLRPGTAAAGAGMESDGASMDAGALPESLSATSAEDTRKLAEWLLSEKVDLILFAGGDGTARDVYQAVELSSPCVGIPAGVKIHSPVYAKNPRAAGRLALLWLTGKLSMTQEEEVLDIDEEHFYTSALATAAFLKKQAPGCTAFVIGAPGLLNALYDVGVTMNDVDPDYVIVGETASYNYEVITKAVRLVLNGARLIATNSDLTGPTEFGIAPACRSLVAPIELATGKKAYFMGKPNPLMMRTGLHLLGVHSEEAAMVGDRMDTDVISGMESGMATVLVLSGVSTRATLDEFAYRPSVVLDGVGDIPRLAQQG